MMNSGQPKGGAGRLGGGVLALIAAALVPSTARGELFNGVEFPLGKLSFADAVVKYDLHDATGVAAPYNDPSLALGPPDYLTDPEKYVSLGNVPGAPGTSSELILRFNDNALVDVAGDDLYVFEIGASVEALTVEVSTDGTVWHDLGSLAGATRGIDLAKFPAVPKQAFQFVRLRDFADGETSNPPWGGPDIDAVGAIGSVALPDGGAATLDGARADAVDGASRDGGGTGDTGAADRGDASGADGAASGGADRATSPVGDASTDRAAGRAAGGGGCNCVLAARNTPHTPSLLLSALGVVLFARRRR